MKKETAVSPVMGETLMIALVLILVPIVTISLMNQLPDDRIPTVTIKMGPLSGSSVTLCHKGGDWIYRDEIRILVNGETDSSWKDTYLKRTFDLGDRITLPGVMENAAIRVVVKNSVIFNGVARS